MRGQEELYSTLPDVVLGDAYLTGNGELLWPAPVAAEVLRWLGEKRLAVLGGELYARSGPMQTTFVSEWSTEPGWRDNEDWEEFARRGISQGLEAIQLTHGDRTGALRDLKYYFVVSGRDELLATAPPPREAPPGEGK